MKRSIWKGGLFFFPLPVLSLFFLFEIYPFLYGLFLTFSDGKKYYSYVVGDPNLILSFKISLLYGILSVLLTFLLGFIFAIIFEKDLRFGTWYKLLFFIPWAIPKYIFILSFRALLHGYDGVSLFNNLFGTSFNLVESNFYSWLGILFVGVILSLPFTTIIIKDALDTTDKELKYISYLDGATPLEYYLNIVLPQIYPTIVPLMTLEFIKSFKVFNIVYLMTQGGPPLLEGFSEKSIVGATTTLSFLAYTIFNENDDPVFGIAYSVIIGIIILSFLFLLFFSYHITKRYKRYKGIYVFLPLIFHILGYISSLGIGKWELLLILLYIPPLYFYIKRSRAYRKVFLYSFLVDIGINTLFIFMKKTPFSFSVGTIFTFFMLLFIRPPINIVLKRRKGYGEFYKNTSYWLGIIISGALTFIQRNFIETLLIGIVSLLFHIMDVLKFATLGVLVFALFSLKGPGAKIIILILLFMVIMVKDKGIKKDNHPLFHIIIVIYLFIILLPFYNILWISLSSKNTLLINSPIPIPVTLSNFYKLLHEEGFLLYLKNTLYVSSLSFLLSIIVSFPFAYFITKRNLSMVSRLAKNGLIYISAFTGIYTLLPLYIIFRTLHLLNSLSALSFIFVLNVLPAAIITIEGALSNLSPSYEEAAALDGAGRTRSLLYIVLPLVSPSLLVSGILGFMSAWGGFFAPLIFINDDRKYLVSLKLFSYVGEIGAHYPSWTLFSAGAIISMIPVLLLFWIVKRPKKGY